MAQITNGIRAILSHPIAYTAFQTMMGAHKARKNFVENYLKPFSNMKILDIGCGPADILAYLPDVDYLGYDISELYIRKANAKYGVRGKFFCKQLQLQDLEDLPKFDMVLALGLLHHLDDEVAVKVLELAYAALKPGGRLLTIDPCFDPSQNAVSRFLVAKDRGQNVRTKQGYLELAGKVFSISRADLRHQQWIPFTHCFMECQK